MKSSHSNIPHSVESIAVTEFFEDYGEQLQLRLVTSKKSLSRSTIRERSVNRPALAVTGYFKYFAHKRIQLLVQERWGFFESRQKFEKECYFHHGRKEDSLRCGYQKLGTTEMVEVLEQHGVPLFRTSLSSKAFTTEVTVLLEERFAPRSSLHGTLLEIRGIGTLIRGESGAGKSEAALALLERGHSLVADDVVKIKLLSDHTPVGFCDDLNRGFMECRGIGIINVEKLFGIRFVRLEKKIELVVTLLDDSSENELERTGLERKSFDILGVPVPHMEIPVRVGRDMARLVEVAAMVQAARQFSYVSN